MAAALLSREGLGRFYRLRTGSGLAIGDRGEPRQAWLAQCLETARKQDEAGPLTLTFDLEGITCAACVWVIEALFSKRQGGIRVVVNPARGQLQLSVHEPTFGVADFLRDLDTLGYRAGPARREHDTVADDLLLRLGVTTALAMNISLISASFYFGLSAADGMVAETFVVVAWVLATLSVVIGLPVFARGALAAARRGVVHLDLPIALGMVLAWAGSTFQLVAGANEASYVDTLAVFIALVLLGRWLQRSAVQKNRRLLLMSTPQANLQTRRLTSGSVVAISGEEIAIGDELLIVPGDHLPVRATALDHASEVSLAWISGESLPVSFARGDEIPAGAHHHGGSSFRVRALETLAESNLFSLLQPVSDPGEGSAGGYRVAPLYVLVVVAAAFGGAFYWTHFEDLRTGLNVAVAVLVVSCPCALGLALPLAREMASTRLRQAGVFLRRTSVLDRLSLVRRVAFDKTGTLTLRRLRVRNLDTLLSLPESATRALNQMVMRSRHPVSKAIAAALCDRGVAPLFDDSAIIEERAGQGLSYRQQDIHEDEQAYSLTRPQQDGAFTASVLKRNGIELCRLEFDEECRPQASTEVAKLIERGLEVCILSGDQQDRVDAITKRLGLNLKSGRGGLSPEAKAEAVRRGPPTLMIGDGVNDGPALDAALAAGAAPSDDGGLPEHADFFLLGEGLGPLRSLFDLQQRYQTTVQRNYIFALSYNALVVSFALAGLMTPLGAALAMPLSSLLVVGHTALGLRAGRAGTARNLVRLPSLPSAPQESL